MARCLVTGHKGYIGSRLFKKLKELGHEVEISGYASDAEEGKGVEVDNVDPSHDCCEGLREWLASAEDRDRLEVGDELRRDHQDRSVVRGGLGEGWVGQEKLGGRCI